MKKNNFCYRVILFIVLSHSFTSFALKRASAGRETVKNKLYPKKNKIEVSFPFGIILNQALIDSQVVGGSVGYYFNEQWGFHIEYIKSLNEDRGQRYCLENFYNDSNSNLSASCANVSMKDPDEGLYDPNGKLFTAANFGPVYLGIREIDFILTGSVSWNPIYGKQLSFLSLTNRFDIFLNLGVGLTFSDYYEDTNETTIKETGETKTLRGVLKDDELKNVKTLKTCPKTIGICPDESYDYRNYIGTAGRPKVSKDMTFTLSSAIGQKVHFANYFHGKAEIRNYTLFGTQDTIDTFFVVWVGLGFRFL
jgi:outer membrane beta-barrel protein